MRIPIEWLREFLDFDLSAGEVSMKLTMAGLEVEASEEIDGDTVLEVNVTPNRPDCLSIIGIARELAALLDLPLRMPESDIGEEGGHCEVNVGIIDDELCQRYAGRAIIGVKTADSPEWIKKRIEKCGMRPINNIVDITNYMLLEMGHPLHAFDMDTLNGMAIRVARASAGSKIKTLDGVDRDLSENALLIWDSTRPVAIAGVMGGADTEVSGKTKNVFLESAYFYPSSIRRTSRTLGLKTEASYRFERGTDIEGLVKALDRAAGLIARIAGGTVSKRVDAYPKPYDSKKIRARYQKINRTLGTALSEDDMSDIMKRLGFGVEKAADCFFAIAPSFRTDVKNEIDIVEEIARFHGYDRIPVTVPRIPVSRDRKSKHYSYMSLIEESLRRSGFSEAVNYSFMNYSMLDLLNISQDDPRRKAVVLRNPLNVEESHLRTTITPSLVRNLVHNVSMGIRDVRLFETARVFTASGEPLPHEVHHLGAIYLRDKSPVLWKEDAPDLYTVKGALEAVIKELKIEDVRFQPSSEMFLHKGKSSDIYLSGKKAGYIGVLHPDITEALSLKLSKPEVVLLEIDLDMLISLIPDAMVYAPIPRYPYIERDIAMIVDESLRAGDVIDLIRNYKSDLIEEAVIFDSYKGKNIPDGMKSLAFNIRYRAKDRTLTDPEVESVHRHIVETLVKRTGGALRGA